jgi:hypothetical protein
VAYRPRNPITGSTTSKPNDPSFGRAIGWAILAWTAAIGVVYLVSQVFGHPELGGSIALAGFIVGTWIGGRKGGVRGAREWAALTAILVAIAFLALGLVSCAYAIALYG